MGESSPVLRPDFNKSLLISASSARLTNSAGAALLRAVLDRTGLVPFLCPRISDDRHPDLLTHSVSELFRTHLILGALGFSTQSSADIHRIDLLLRAAVSDRSGLSPFRELPPGQPLPRNPKVPLGLPSQPTLSRDVTRLSTQNHRDLMREGLLHLALHNQRRFGAGRLTRILVDLDSMPITVSGEQKGSKHNGHYHARIFHPLVAFMEETGDLLDVQLREGQVHTADGVIKFISRLLRRLRKLGCRVELYLRMDAGFPSDRLFRKLERARVRYVARIPNRKELDALAGPFLGPCDTAQNGTPQSWAFETTYKADSWKTARRVVPVFQDQGEPGSLLNWFWLITNLTPAERSAPELLNEYRRRGTFESRLGEWNQVAGQNLSSTNRPKSHYRGQPVAHHEEPVRSFEQNEAQLLLNALSYGLLNTTRLYQEAQTRRANQERVAGVSLQRLREEILRVGGRVVKHARRAMLRVSQEIAERFQLIWGELAALK